MENIMLTVGNVIIDEHNNKKYRVVSIHNDDITLCEMDITSLSLSLLSVTSLLSLIANGELTIYNEENFIFNKNNLPEDAIERFELKYKIMTEVLKQYGPSYMGLMGKKSKNNIATILEKYNYPKSSFWKLCTKYFQSGFQDYSLVDSRYLGLNKGKTYSYESKAGRPEIYQSAGIVIDERIQQYLMRH